MSNAKHRAPPCFRSDEHLISWRNAHHYAGEKLPSGYCTDCTKDYQARMCAESRCKYPETAFIVQPQGGIVGVRKAA